MSERMKQIFRAIATSQKEFWRTLNQQTSGLTETGSWEIPNWLLLLMIAFLIVVKILTH